MLCVYQMYTINKLFHLFQLESFLTAFVGNYGSSTQKPKKKADQREKTCIAQQTQTSIGTDKSRCKEKGAALTFLPEALHPPPSTQKMSI